MNPGSPEPGETAPGSGRCRGAVLCALFVVVALWPPLGAPLDRSFDSSWMWGVNEIAARHLAPALLPAGPLGGWLMPRRVAGGGLAGAAAYQILTRCLWAWALIGLARRGGSAWRWAAGVALWIAATAICGRWPDYDVILLVLALLTPSLLGVSSRWRELAAGALLGLAPLLKLSAGLEGAGLVVGAALAAPLAGVVAWRDVGAMLLRLAAAAMAVVSTAAWLVFPSWPDAHRWLLAAPSVLHGYGDAMGLPANVLAERAIVAPLLAVWAVVLLSRRRGAASVILPTALALPIVAAFKHALVRPDVHALSLGYLASGVLVLVALASRERREAWTAMALGLLGLALVWPHATRLPGVVSTSPWALASGLEGAENAAQSFRPSARAARLDRSTWGGTRADREPGLDDLRSAAGGVDVLPWRLTILVANRLEESWIPSPSLQLYQASTPALEELAARHFASGAAPRWLIVHAGALDGRNLLWEAPRVWREVAARYRVHERFGQFLVLERRASPERWVYREVKRERLEWGRWTEPPTLRQGESLVGEIALVPTLLGRLQRWAERAEPVWIDVEHGRRHKRWRLVPDLARYGLELGDPPRGLDDLEAWLGGRAGPEVQRIRVRSVDAGSYRPVEIRWLAMRLVGGAG